MGSDGLLLFDDVSQFGLGNYVGWWAYVTKMMKVPICCFFGASNSAIKSLLEQGPLFNAKIKRISLGNIGFMTFARVVAGRHRREIGRVGPG